MDKKKQIKLLFKKINESLEDTLDKYVPDKEQLSENEQCPMEQEWVDTELFEHEEPEPCPIEKEWIDTEFLEPEPLDACPIEEELSIKPQKHLNNKKHTEKENTSFVEPKTTTTQENIREHLKWSFILGPCKAKSR